jgi:two-component system nitrogen regulation response regulator NtrX
MIFLDVLLPKLGGLEALEKIRKDFPAIEIVMISGHANVDMAVKAVKLGAFDFLEKPLSLEKVLTVCRNALEIKNLREENQNLKKTNYFAFEEIIGTSAAIRKVREMVKQAAASDTRILITGENGAGKEVVAKAIHQGSSRAGGPFIDVNCAAIPDTLLESELFGHEKGAFTDAIASRKGRFEMAHGGTLFLDEIGDMSLSAQAKVLRVIQDQKIERLGGEKSILADVRIIAASNKNLEKACADGLFRQDLFFRINVIPIHISPLRERPEDISLLFFHFLKIMNVELSLDTEAMELLTSYEWPGNVRELKNLAERIAVMHKGSDISAEALKELLNTTGKQQSPEDSALKDFFTKNLNDAKDNFEKRYLEFHLLENGGIISKTAEAIGVYPSNLHSKIKKYCINAAGRKEE